MKDDVDVGLDDRPDETPIDDRAGQTHDARVSHGTRRQIDGDDANDVRQIHGTGEQRFDETGAEKPRGAGDERVHRGVMLPFHA